LVCTKEKKPKIHRFLMSALIAVQWIVPAIRFMIKKNNPESLEITVVVCHIK